MAEGWDSKGGVAAVFAQMRQSLVTHQARIDLDAGDVEYTTEAFMAAYAFITDRGTRFSTNNEFRHRYASVLS